MNKYMKAKWQSIGWFIGYSFSSNWSLYDVAQWLHEYKQKDKKPLISSEFALKWLSIIMLIHFTALLPESVLHNRWCCIKLHFTSFLVWSNQWITHYKYKIQWIMMFFRASVSEAIKLFHKQQIRDFRIIKKHVPKIR